MARSVIIRRFDGGISSTERPDTINQQTNALGFDIFKDRHKLTKTQSSTYDTASGGSSSTNEATVLDAVKRDTDGLIIGAGVTSSSSMNFRFWRKNSDMTGYWQQNSNAGLSVTNYGVYCNLYKGSFYGYAGGSTEGRLYRYDSDSAQTLIGTTSDANLNYTPKPIVHSQDNILYMCNNKTVSKYDGTTFTASAFTLPYACFGMYEYGTYLAFLFQTPFGCKIGLWGRDTSLTTLQDIIDVDNGKGLIVALIDGYLTTVTQIPYDPYTISFNTGLETPQIIVRMFSGGTMREVARAQIGLSENGSSQFLLNKYFTKDGTLFFSTNSNALWRFGRNTDGMYVLSRDYQAVYSSNNIVSTYGLFALGDYFFVPQRHNGSSPNDGLLARTNQNGFYANSSFYETTINPSMPIEDRNKEKQLTRIAVKVYSQATGSGTVTVKYAFDSASYSTAIAETSISSGYKNYEASAQTDSLPFLSGRDLKLRLEATFRIDYIEVEYEYEILNTLIN